ncbi:MAG: xanthine dehydrogenase family protein subunit M [Chloroflexi bacterium]|nr:xanthine dehydrogenase family protein subunit M [Chloroflexota bacterium]
MIQAVVKRVKSIPEAFEKASGHSGPLYYLAGGTDLVCKAKDRLLPPALWLDISGIEELTGIKDEGDSIHIGSLVTHTALSEHPLIKKYAPALSDAASQVGSPQIRNRGTIGGNSGNASPAGDCVTALYTLDTTIHLECPAGPRSLPLEKFFTGPGKTVCKEKEIITGFSFPKKEGARGCFLKLGQRKTLAISKVSLALSCTLEVGRLHDVKIALGAVAPTVIHAPRCEEMLAGKELNDSLIAESGTLIQTESCPIDDLRSTEGYRCKMTGVLMERALKKVALWK